MLSGPTAANSVPPENDAAEVNDVAEEEAPQSDAAVEQVHDFPIEVSGGGLDFGKGNWYVLKVTVSRGYAGSIIEYQDFMVRNYSPPPSINNSIKESYHVPF